MMKSLPNLATLWRRPRPRVGQTPSDVVWSEGAWRLLHYRARPQGAEMKTPLLLVPSLINRHYVLDLMPGKSFAEAMVAQGFDVFCIDWGAPRAEDRFTTFNDVVDTALGRALRLVADTTPRKKAHVLGYCMGGTLGAIHAAAHPERLASFVALAAPVEFTKEPGLLGAWTNAPGFDVDALVDGLGNIPWQLLQSAFHLLRPTLGLSKLVTLLDRAWNDEFLDGHLALETWGNDNVSLPGEFYRTYIRELYQRDALMKGELELGGRAVSLSAITTPTLAVTFEHDNIVPASSAKALVDVLGAKVASHLHLPGGHVGAVVSKHAAKSLWPQLVEFFAKHDTEPVIEREAIEVPGRRSAKPRRGAEPASVPV